MAQWGPLGEAGQPKLTKLVCLTSGILFFRECASTGLTASPIGIVLPGTRTKHKICVLDFGCCTESHAPIRRRTLAQMGMSRAASYCLRSGRGAAATTPWRRSPRSKPTSLPRPRTRKGRLSTTPGGGLCSGGTLPRRGSSRRQGGGSPRRGAGLRASGFEQNKFHPSRQPAVRSLCRGAQRI